MKALQIKALISVLLFLFFFVSCNSDRASSSDLKVLRNNTTSVDMEEFIDSVEIIPLETNSNALLAEVKSVKMTDNKIFIEDISENVYLFDRKGRFISKIGFKGQGPDEYLSCVAFYIDIKNKNVVIVDELNSCFLRYDLNGNFLYRQKISLSAIKSTQHALLTDENSLLLNHYINFEDNMAYTIVNGNNLQYSEKLFSYNPITSENYMISFSPHPMVETVDGDIHFIMPLCDTIFVLHKGKIKPDYVVEIPRKMAPKEQFKTTVENSYPKMIGEYGQKGYFTGFTSIFETENKILLNYQDQGLVLGYFLFDKLLEKGSYNFYFGKNSWKGIPFFPVISSSKDYFISIMNVQSLLLMEEEKEREENDNLSYNRFLEVLEDIKFDDNPVLFLYHIK